jgi:hypothetical protein
MVIVAQLVEPRIVIPAVVGSSPIGHPSLVIYTPAVSCLSFNKILFSWIKSGVGDPNTQFHEFSTTVGLCDRPI